MKETFTILMLFIGLMAQAADKYIATSANGGSNSNDGSMGTPWLTLSWACANTTTPGDVIHVGVGTFTETARCALSTGVSIVGQGVTSIVKSNFKASSATSAIIYLYSSGVVNGNQSISNIKLTGDYPNGSYGDRGIYTKGRTNVEIHHCTIENFLSSGVKFDGYGVAYNSKTGPTTYLTGNSFHDNILTNCAFFGGSEANLILTAQQGFTCYNNTITQNTRTPGTDGELVKTMDVRGLLFHDNICNSPTNMANQWNFIGEWWSCRGGVEVYNNTFNGAATFDIAGVITEKTIYDFGVKIYNNKFLNPSLKSFNSIGHRVLAICIENWNSMTDIYIYNNYIKNYGDGIEIDVAGQSGYGPSTCDNIHIYYNIFENCGYNTQGYNWGIGVLYAYASVRHNNINICNNVIIGGTPYSYSGIRYDTDHANTNIRIQNNIIKGFSSNAIKFYNNNAGTLDYLWITNNILNGNGSNTISFDGMTPTHYTYDSPITNDPLFVGGSPYNFHLLSGSPAINTGISITSPTISSDYDGVTIGNPPEIGVYEYNDQDPVYYIDPSGSDATGNGTSGNPWKSLYKACATVKNPGEVIHVNAGTYLEMAQSTLSVGVSIEGEGITSIIKSHVSAANTPTIVLSSGTQGTNGNQSISNIKMDGDALTAYSAIKVTGRSNVSIHDCTFIDFNNNGVLFNGASGDGLPTIWAKENKFYNNTVTNCSKYVVGVEGRWALGINGQNGLLIYNNTLDQTSRPPGNNGYLIKGVQGYNKNVKIYNNKIYKAPYNPGSFDFAIEFWDCRGGVEIYDNVITGCIDIGGYFTHKGDEDYAVYIHDNTIGPLALGIHEGVRGVILEGDIADIIVARNHIKNVANGIYFSQVKPGIDVKNVWIYANIIENVGVADGGSNQKGWGVNWTEETYHDHTVDNIHFWNNVILGHVGSRSNMWGIKLPNIGTATNISIKNNIIRDFAYAPIFGNAHAGVETIDNVSIENNIFYQNGYGNIPRYTDITPTNNTTQNNLTSNPLFISSTDFHLQTGSPAIGKGLKITGITTDYDNKTFNNPPSIGAYEYDPTYSSSVIPVFQNAVIESDIAAVIKLNYDLPLANIVPVTSVFTVLVNSVAKPISSVSISGTKVLITLASPVVQDDLVTVAYAKPMDSPIQTISGATADTFTAQPVIKNVQQDFNYYISTSGIDGPGHSGLISDPWKTLSYACSQVKTSGDIIHVKAGTYLETAQSALAVGVSIEGEGVNSIIKSHVSAANTPTIELSSGTQGTNGNQSISNIKMDGDALTAYSAIKVTGRSNVSIHDCTFIDFNNNGVLFNGASGDGLPTIWAKGNKFYNNTVTNCSKYVVGIEGRWALGMNGQEGLLIYDNTMTQTSRPAGNNGYLIKAVEGYNKGIKIYNNTLTRSPAVPGSFDFAIELWNCLGGIEIYNNNLKGSIDFGGRSTVKGTYSYAAHIHHNTIGEAVLNTKTQSVRGILLESTIEDVVIEKNYINNVAAGIYFAQDLQQVKYVKNLKIQYNIFNNIGSGALEYTGWGMYWSQQGSFPHIIDNVNISNNVFIGNSSSATNMWGIGLPRIGKATNIKVRNNIVQGFYYGPTYASGGTGISIDYLSIENNIFNNNGYNNLPRYSEISPTHNTTQNNYTGNPMFVSSTDFQLKSGSPAINAGLDVGLTSDYIGNALVGLPDIGAYEFMTGDNQKPSIQDQGFQLNKNSPDGTAVGTVMATDPNAGQTLTFTIVSGNINNAFSIDALTGVLSVANKAALNADFALVVKVQDSGPGELSRQATILINIIPTGLELTGNNATIKVYPNPVYDELTIEIKGNNDRLIFNILNSTGQIVFKGNLAEKTVVQTTNFSPGVYLVKIENSKSFEFKKIVKV